MEQTNQTTLFKNNKPGRDWWSSFLKRLRNDISIRKAGNIGTLRAASCTNEIVDHFFNNCKEQFDAAKIDTSKASNVWNFDETGFNGDQGKVSIVCRKGAQN